MIIDEMLIEALGWTLVHFLWQGLVIGLVHELALLATAKRSPHVRYGISLGALLAVLASPSGTFAWLLVHVNTGTDAGTIQASIPVLIEAAGVAGVAHAPSSLLQVVDAALPYVVVLWLLGVAALSLRFGAGLLALEQLARTADFDAVSGWIRADLARLVARMEIGRSVRIALSGRVNSPLVVGWLKPVIFLPLSAATGLDHQQIRMVLAHELAHLRRHDPLVNLVQVIVETLLFYHPVVHRISRSLRQEREQCCDDVAADIGGNALAYARVLARLEEMRQRSRTPMLALGIAEQELFARIQRLVGAVPSRTSPDRWLPLILIALATIASLGKTPDMNAPLLPALFEESTARQRISLELPPVESRPFRPIVNNAVKKDAPTQTASLIPKQKVVNAELRNQPQTETLVSAIDSSVALVREEAATDASPRAAMPAENAAAVSTTVVTGGKLLHAEEPVYPRRARRAGEEGQVLLEFTITPEGHVTAIETLEASPRGLFESAARDAIAQWRYQPFTENGEPVARRATQVMEFRLVGESRRGGTSAGDCDEKTGTRLCRSTTSDLTELRVVND